MPKGAMKFRGISGATPLGLRYIEGEDGGAGAPTPNPPADPEKPAGEPKPAGEDFKDRYEAQQKVNRDLEAKLNELRDGLKSALGVDDKKIDVASLVKGLSDEIGSLKHQNLVNAVARDHGITEAKDIAILASVTDQAVMTTLAERLKPSEDNSKPGKPGTPQPDPSAGRGGGSGSGAVTKGVSAGRDLWDETNPTKK